MKKVNSGEYWDFRLTPGPGNEYPLAPGDLVRAGQVNETNYRRQNMRFGKFCDKTVEPQLRELPERGGVHVLGAGLARDLSWIKTAVDLPFKLRVKILDFSDVAVKKAREELGYQYRPGLATNVEVIQTEILAGWESGTTSYDDIVAMYASQFLEHQGDNLPKFLAHFAAFLRKDPLRRIFLVYPRLEDNPPETVHWNSAVPQMDHEWQQPLRDNFGDGLKIDVLGTHLYFHRKYTMFRIGA